MDKKSVMVGVAIGFGFMGMVMAAMGAGPTGSGCSCGGESGKYRVVATEKYYVVLNTENGSTKYVVPNPGGGSASGGF